MKKLVILFILLILVTAGALFNVPPIQKTEATGLPHVTICHKEVQPHLTLSVSIAALPAHLAHGDSLGACPAVTPTPTPTEEPTPTPTVEPSVTPTVTPNPCDEVEVSKVDLVLDINPCITPTPTEEPTPTATPTATPTGQPGTPPTFAGSSTEAPTCGDGKPARVANIYVKSTGNKGELEVQWALPAGADTVHIEYGLQKNAQHALLNTPNDGNEVIRDLKSGEHYWFRVAGVDGCAVGDFSDWFDPLVP